uniref:Uncharacterized protein n=1 Tax=Cacopsylla melanoneura TaxID=428564 RepID=A0A8D8ZD25_9HEMI
MMALVFINHAKCLDILNMVYKIILYNIGMLHSGYLSVDREDIVIYRNKRSTECDLLFVSVYSSYFVLPTMIMVMVFSVFVVGYNNNDVISCVTFFPPRQVWRLG